MNCNFKKKVFTFSHFRFQNETRTDRISVRGEGVGVAATPVIKNIEDITWPRGDGEFLFEC